MCFTTLARTTAFAFPVTPAARLWAIASLLTVPPALA